MDGQAKTDEDEASKSLKVTTVERAKAGREKGRPAAEDRKRGVSSVCCCSGLC